MLRVARYGVRGYTLQGEWQTIRNPKPIVSQIPDRETLLLICLQLLSTALIFNPYGCQATLLDFG